MGTAGAENILTLDLRDNHQFAILDHPGAVKTMVLIEGQVAVGRVADMGEDVVIAP
jgi:hypothetical protein